MPVTDHTSNVLAALLREFPLRARLERLDPDVRRTYGAIVSEWYGTAAPPQPPKFEPSHLAALEQADAVVVVDAGIGCYPFSAAPTGIRVTYLDRSCHAMCAIDALAIPCVIGQSATIDATCNACRRRLTIAVGPRNGSLSIDSNDIAVTHSGVSVMYAPKAAEHGVCNRQLCPLIVFVCDECADPGSADLLSVAAATVVAAQFFSFQRKYLPPKASAPEHA